MMYALLRKSRWSDLSTAANLAAGAPATCRRGLVARAPAGWWPAVLRWIGCPERRPRPAAREAPSGARSAAKKSVFANRFASVHRAGWSKATLDDSVKVRRDVGPIRVDRRDRRPRIDGMSWRNEQVISDPHADNSEGDQSCSAAFASFHSWSICCSVS